VKRENYMNEKGQNYETREEGKMDIVQHILRSSFLGIASSIRDGHWLNDKQRANKLNISQYTNLNTNIITFPAPPFLFLSPK
jgi:hypothetical protein